MDPNSEMEVRATGVGASRCDDLARVQRAEATVRNGSIGKSRSAPDTARGHRGAMTLPTQEFGLKSARPELRNRNGKRTHLVCYQERATLSRSDFSIRSKREFNR